MKPTNFQVLNRLFNNPFNYGNIQDVANTKETQTKIIIKGKTRDDVKRKALELEQQQKLREKFFKTSERSYQKALQYEAGRFAAHLDYEGMEYYPIISSALDLFMEESNMVNKDGNVLKVESNNARIKENLEDLFYNRLNINVNLPFWTRNTVKYGDNFVLLYGENTKGITTVKQLVNFEIDRTEKIENGKAVIKFTDRMTNSVYNSFEIAHFRLLSDDKNIPYGSSILNKIRRVFRQLVMAEDAMLTYRIIRAGEKKVYKIDVGNLDEDDIDEYIMKVAEQMKRTPQVNNNNGQIDYRFNMLNNDEDIFLPVRNANVSTGVDTLPGASNLNDINDIEYLRDNLFTGLGVPKPFLSFQDAAGGGKNMAQYDIRFSKKIIRIQQCMVQELNKIALIHLFLLGFSLDEIYDFKLSMTNPSSQLELMQANVLKEKTQLYADLTRNENNGIAAMSHTNAKKLVFNMTDAEIVLDLKQQKMEKVIAQELADAPALYKKTGIFKTLDDKYSDETAVNNAMMQQQDQGENGEQISGQPPIGGDVGGGNVSPEFETNPELPNQSPSDLPPINVNGESVIDKLFKKDNKLIKQSKILLENKKFVNEANLLISEIDNKLGVDEKELTNDVYDFFKENMT